MIIFQAPPGSLISDQYKLTLNGIDCPVYWTQIHQLHYAYFDFSTGPVEVRVTKADAQYWSHGARVCPTSKHINPDIDAGTVTFTIHEPGQFTLEKPDLDYHNMQSEVFVLAANLPETDMPDPHDPHVTFFGPGMHDLGEAVLELTDNQSIYVAGGAVVRARRIIAKNAKNIGIRGHGMLFLSPPVDWANMIDFRYCQGITLQGYTLLSQPIFNRGFTHLFADCRDILMRNVKIFGFWDNHDGMHMQAASNVTVEHCMIRSHDDAIAIYGDSQFGTGNPRCENITVQHCVLWPVWSGVCRIGTNDSHYITPTHAHNITFKNCDVLHMQDYTTFPYGFLLDMREQKGFRNYEYKNILFEDIRMGEIDAFINLHLEHTTGGIIRNMVFKNISVSAQTRRTAMNDHSPIPQDTPGFSYLGCNDVDQIIFENIVLQGKPALSANDIGATLHGVLKTDTETLLFRTKS
jgi:hypothetical protein